MNYSNEHHDQIKKQLLAFYESGCIPNIIFSGTAGSGKSKFIFDFINTIYKTPEDKQNYVKTMNCSQGSGIEGIRKDLIPFAKTNTCDSSVIKIIILINADKLTNDASFALRRCIEQYSSNTRFIMTVETEHNLLSPIISRFCIIHVSEILIKGERISFYKLQHNYTFDNNTKNINKIDKNKDDKNRDEWLKKELNKIYDLSKKQQLNKNFITEITNKIYNKGYSALDILNNVDKFITNDLDKYAYLFECNKIKKEFRNEELFINYCLVMLLNNIT
jgi:DNA polymerase III delta prime subunit